MSRVTESVMGAAVALLVSVAAAAAQSPENVAVVVNEASAASQRVGEYYARKRGLPPGNVIRIRTSTDETVERAVYSDTIESPIAAALQRGGLQDRILYLVLTTGVPLKVSASAGGDLTSVDAQLTMLYRRMVGGPSIPNAGVANPYFLRAGDLSEARRFSHRDHDIYLVTRLDGYTVADVLALIDRGASPASEGRVVLDQQDKLVDRAGEEWLERAAQQLTQAGHGERVLLETTIKGVRNIAPVLGYYGWGSEDPRNRVRTFGLGFVPGSLAATYAGTDARTFREPPADWVPGGGADKGTYAGSSQSLLADLIREGATGLAGEVAEGVTSVQDQIRPDVLFPAYLSGFNLAEAFYLAMPHVNAHTVVIGDPLCVPFAGARPAAPDLDGGIDKTTGLPAWFSARRVTVARLAAPDVSERAIALLVRAEAMSARGDRAATRAALEQAALLAPNHVPAHLQLAGVFEASGQHFAAIERYRRVLALEPKNVIALNNLAYALAVHRGAPKEALPLARQALELAPRSAMVLDTVAWVEYLSGDVAAAAKRIPDVVRALPSSAEVRLHAATIYAAAGARAVAEVELQEALKLQPALEKSVDVRRVRELLAALAKR